MLYSNTATALLPAAVTSSSRVPSAVVTVATPVGSIMPLTPLAPFDKVCSSVSPPPAVERA